MREWLVIWLSHFLRSLLGRTSSPATEAKESEKEEPAKCPICGEEWEKGEVFCYHCGYEEKDRELTLFPPPEHSGALVDPDGVIDKESRQALSEKLRDIGNRKGLDVAVLVMPEKLRTEMNDPEKPGKRSLEGIAHCLYNSWQMGKETDLKGLLLIVDPSGSTRVLAQGRKGPGIGGTAFREWYTSLQPPEESADRVTLLRRELDHIADKIDSL